jgi:hypothetical protein
MSERESAKKWRVADCGICGKPFGQEESWMDNCPICFKESKGYKLLKGDLAFACLQEEVARLQDELAQAEKRPPEEAAPTDEVTELRAESLRLSASVEKWKAKARDLKREVERLRMQQKPASPTETAAPIDLTLLRKMLLLCHPDKNPNNIELSTEVTQWLLTQKSKISP